METYIVQLQIILEENKSNPNIDPINIQKLEEHIVHLQSIVI